MRICFIPIDNRPVCYNLVKDICSIDEDIELLIPPREYLGGLTTYADTDKLFEWLKADNNCDIMIISLDTLCYGGLVPSRRITDSFEKIKSGIERLIPIIETKKVFAFSSIMRISNNNYNEEEKEYWNKWGKKIFQYSYLSDKNGTPPESDIPKEILNDYLNTRKRNFEINKMYLNWQKAGLFDTLIFSKDDCAEFGFNVAEAHELEILGGYTKTGADEIPLTLLARALNKDIKIFPKFTEEDYKNCISNYEDVSIEKSVLGQLELGGFKIAQDENSADVVLLVNNFAEKQGEHVMGWETSEFSGHFVFPDKDCAVADVRFANGGDNKFINAVFKNNFPVYGYSGWNTSANSLGSLLAGIKVKYNAKNYNDIAFKKLQIIRLLDDWAYQANVRKLIDSPCDIKKQMQPYEEIVFNKLGTSKYNIEYSFPWNRKFEIEVTIK